MHHPEECDVRADSECEAKNGDDSEPRRLEPLPKSVADHGRDEELRSGAIETHSVLCTGCGF